MNRQQVNGQRPTPPSSQYLPPNNLEDRLDFKIARVLDEPSPTGVQSQQHYFPPLTSPFTVIVFFFFDKNIFYSEPKRQEKTTSPRNNDDDNAVRQNTYDEQ